MTPALEVRNLSYEYPDGTHALRGVSFSIAPGECVGLIGPNGAGKSTLLLHLNGILPDRSRGTGEVYVDGEKITPKTVDAARRKVGLLFQDPDDQLFCPTVFEDVAFGPQQFGLNGELPHIVRRSLDAVGLAGFEKRAPHRLSGGEKRRACLAGVLACQPRVLVLDEPTSNLDPRGRRQIKDLLRQLPATKLIASHDLELILELCPRTIVLDEGTIVADGPTPTLLANRWLMDEHGLETPHALRDSSAAFDGTTFAPLAEPATSPKPADPNPLRPPARG
jgi:energy-coupling factor transporter ATP-binding protein EcfA2